MHPDICHPPTPGQAPAPGLALAPSAALCKPHAVHLDVLAVVPLIELHDLILDAKLVHGLFGLQFAPSGYRHTDGAKTMRVRMCARAGFAHSDNHQSSALEHALCKHTRRAPSRRMGILTWKKSWPCCCKPCAECQSLALPAGARISPQHMHTVKAFAPHRSLAHAEAPFDLVLHHRLQVACADGRGRAARSANSLRLRTRRAGAHAAVRAPHLRPSRAGRRRQRQRGACRRAAASRPAPSRQTPARQPAGPRRTHPPCRKTRVRSSHYG